MCRMTCLRERFVGYRLSIYNFILHLVRRSLGEIGSFQKGPRLSPITAYKPDSVRITYAWQPFIYATYPRIKRREQALRCFVLLRMGFTPLAITTSAVRSYRTFSPLPFVAHVKRSRAVIFCGTFRGPRSPCIA